MREAFPSVIEDVSLLTKIVKINQSEGILGSGTPESTFVKNSYKRSHISLPSPIALNARNRLSKSELSIPYFLANCTYNLRLFRLFCGDSLGMNKSSSATCNVFYTVMV